MLKNIAGAKLNVHLVALVMTGLGVVFSGFMADPVAVQWIAAHWWASDLAHTLPVAVMPILVYFGVGSSSQS